MLDKALTLSLEQQFKLAKEQQSIGQLTLEQQHQMLISLMRECFIKDNQIRYLMKR